MKKFLIKLGIFVTCQLAVAGVALVVYFQRLPPSQSFYASSLDKHHLLQTRPSPRMIFIGGSSMALGMDSARVARPLGFQPINMGLNMGIGLEFMLDEVVSSLRAGDVVVVGAEYHTFQKSYRAEPEYVARLIECRPSILLNLPFRTVRELLDHGYHQHLGRVLRTLLHVGDTGGMWDNLVNPYNHRGAFNENGDVVAHHGAKLARGGTLQFTFDSPELADAAIDHLNRFHAECAQRGVRVFYSHPPYEQRYFDSYRAAIEALEARMKSRLTMPMLDTPGQMTFPSEEIFDVEYHLNLAGKNRRSDRVARSLAKALAATNQVAP